MTKNGFLYVLSYEIPDTHLRVYRQHKKGGTVFGRVCLEYELPSNFPEFTLEHSFGSVKFHVYSRKTRIHFREN